MPRYGPPHPWMHRHPHPWGGGFSPGPGPDPSMALSALSTVLWIVLFIGITWMVLWWVFPYVKPIIAGFFGGPPADLSPLDRLRQRYAAGEIDGETFVQMRERLVASYEPKDIRPGEDSYPPEIWNGHRGSFSPPGSNEQGKARMMEQEQYSSDGK